MSGAMGETTGAGARRLGGAAEAAVFLGAALLLHLAFFVRFDLPTGLASGGAGGRSEATLSAAGPELAALVGAWDAAPEAREPPPAPPPAAAPPRATIRDAAPRLLAPGLGPGLPERAAPTAPETSDPAPRAKPQAETPPERVGIRAAEAAPRPRPRPAQAPARSALPVAEAPAAPPPPEPVARAAPAAPGPERAAARAEGAGGGAEAGRGDAPESAGDGPEKASLAEAWGGAIRAAVEREKRFPSMARTGGRAEVWLEIGPDGALLAAKIAKSAGPPALDRAALDAVRAAAPYPAAPAALGAGPFAFTLPVRFRR